LRRVARGWLEISLENFTHPERAVACRSVEGRRGGELRGADGLGFAGSGSALVDTAEPLPCAGATAMHGLHWSGHLRACARRRCSGRSTRI
jgi:hypothetical protein